MSVLSLIKNKINPIDLSDEKYEIKKISYEGDRCSEGQVDKQT